MSIFKEMHETHSFNSYEEFVALQRMLSSAIARGFVKQVPVMIPSEFSPNITWYQDIETQEVYSLTPPNPPARVDKYLFMGTIWIDDKDYAVRPDRRPSSEDPLVLDQTR
jgi:hypothetical protein